MSEHGTTSSATTEPELGLTEADLARALDRSRHRGQALVRRRRKRMAVGSGVAAALLLVAGVGVVSALQDDGRELVVTPAGGDDKVLAPAATTTTSPPVPTSEDRPPGYEYGTSADGSVSTIRYVGADDQTTSTAAGGVAIGGGTSEERLVEPVQAVRIDDHHVEIAFACVMSASDRVTSIDYSIVDERIAVDATVEGLPGRECTDGVGSRFVLPFRDVALPGSVRAVAQDLPA